MSKRNRNKQTVKQTSGYVQWIWIATVLLITAIVYSGVNQLDFQMQWDDHEQVVNNEMVKDLSLDNLKEMFSGYVIGMYQPLTTLSYAMDYQISGLDAGQYHSTNLWLHLLNTFLVWLLFRKLTRRIDIASVLALLFAIHPMQAETVYWISTRSNLLFTTFFLSGWLAWIQYHQNRQKSFYLLALGMMLLSCLSKSMAVTFPLVLLVFDYFRGTLNMKAAIEKLPFFALSLIFGVVAISYTDPAEIELDALAPLIDQVFYLFYSLHFYLLQALLPLKLSAAHYFPTGNSLPWPYYFAPITLLLAVLPGVFIKSIRRPYFFGLAFFLVTIALVVLVPGRRTIVSERYVYLPYIGLFFALSTLLLKLLKDNPSSLKPNYKLLFIAGLVSIPAAIVTADRNETWKDSNTLFADVVEKYPENYHGYAVRGLYYLTRKNANDAIPQFEAAVERKSDFHEGWYNLGIAYGNHLQQSDNALQYYDEAIAVNPTEPKYFIARGTLLGRMKKFKQAQKDFDEALRIDPENPRAYENLGVIYADQKDFKTAIEYYSQSIALDPSNANTYISRGAAYSFLEQHEQAIADYDAALARSPSNAQAIFNRGVSEFKRSNIQKACIDWKKAMDMGNAQAANAWHSYCNTQNANR